MGDNFENKKSGSFLKVLIPLILILAIAGGAFFFFTRNKEKPVNVFKSNVEKAFKKAEVKEDSKTAKATFTLTANLDSDNVNIKALKQYVESAKITYTQEADLNKRIMKYNATVDFDNEQIIDADMILQNGKIYVFAQEFFSKYVEINPEDFGVNGYNEMLDEIFKVADKVSTKETNKLMKDIEKTVIDFLEKQEYTKENEEITVGGKEYKATKSTLVLNEKQMTELLSNVLTVVKDSEYVASLMSSSNVDIKEELEDAIDNLKESDEGKSTLEISIYTHGVAGEVIRVNAVAKEDKEVAFKVNYEKESKEKSVVAFEVENTKIKLEINKKDKNTTVYTLVLPEEFEGVGLSLEHTKDGENKGKIVISVKLPGALLATSGITDDVEAKLNITYDISENVKVEEADVSNAVSAKEFNEEHQQELMNNFQKSKLYSLIAPFIGQ